MCCIYLSGCTFGYEGLRSFSETFDLEEIQALALALPDTPIAVTGCDPSLVTCGREAKVSGEFHSFGGTRRDAKDLTRAARLDFQSEEGFGRITLVKTLEAQDLVDLEIDQVVIPSDLDLDLSTSIGDLEVRSVSGAITAETRAGNIDIEGGDAGVVASTGYGWVRVETAGIADLSSDWGGIDLVQTGAAANAYVFTRGGDIEVELASDASVHLTIVAPGRIEVHTTLIQTITSGHFERETGSGSVDVELRTHGGGVTVRLYEPPLP
jgi:hypothetical protein